VKKIGGEWCFLSEVFLLYFLIFFVDRSLFANSAGFFFAIIMRIVPIFILVFILMTIANLFITPRVIVKYFRKRGIEKWFFVIGAGILSTGPIYLWYPLLAELREKGISYGFLATFLYNRAIKVPLLPVALFYFGLKYVIVLTLMMIFFSVIQGMLINKLVPTDPQLQRDQRC
jgi:uncharacterized membrane protein YraQ (UPF0718 family)